MTARPAYTAEDVVAGIQFARAWEARMKTYARMRASAQLFGRAGLTPDHPHFRHFVLAAREATRLGVSHDDYLSAHFVDAHRRHGRAPYASQLHNQQGFTAAAIVDAWRRATAAGQTAAVVAPRRAVRRSPARTAQRQEHYLADLAAKWGVHPDDVIRAFGGADAGVFDPTWLRRRRDWRRLDKEGWFRTQPGPDVAFLRRRQAELHSKRCS